MKIRQIRFGSGEPQRTELVIVREFLSGTTDAVSQARYSVEIPTNSPELTKGAWTKMPKGGELRISRKSTWPGATLGNPVEDSGLRSGNLWVTLWKFSAKSGANLAA